MEHCLWTSGNLDERYLVLSKERALCVCRVLGGHKVLAEDEIGRRLKRWWEDTGVQEARVESVLHVFHECASVYSDLKGLYAAAVIANSGERSLSLSHVGGFLSLYRNGRKVVGGRENSIEWKSAVYDDVHIGADLQSMVGRIRNFTIPLEGDELLIGTPFLDCYASEADLAFFRADKRRACDKLALLGDELIHKADQTLRARSPFDPFTFKRDRFMAAIVAD